MRFFAASLVLALGLAPAARADVACARRAAVLQLLFAAANGTETADAARAPVEAALAAASDELSARGCPSVELAVDELWIRARRDAHRAAAARASSPRTAPPCSGASRCAARAASRSSHGSAISCSEGAIESSRAPARGAHRRRARREPLRRAPLGGAPGGLHVSADAGAIRFAPRSVGEPAPFPPDAVLLSFHAPERAEETEITGR